MCNDRQLAPYALHPEKRRADMQKRGCRFRQHEEETRKKDDERTDYHRDRDRIIWSNAFRRLQNKTQVFAHDDDDHYRRRLTHSIEVAGIACSIARRLKLNEVATDAIALGHDIGHAPFGHAGEDALNKISMDSGVFRRYYPRDVQQPIPLTGFNHCAHAIEIVTRIETLNGAYPGLDLSFDIRDGILKHIYHTEREPSALEREPFSALSEIVSCKEYEEYGRNYGSLEAQCVWFADKLTYLFDDLEDAIRAKIFRFDIIKRLGIQGEPLNVSNGYPDGDDIAGTEESTGRAREPLECDIVMAARGAGLSRVLAEKFRQHYTHKYGADGITNLYTRAGRIQQDHPDDEVRQFLFWRNKAMTVIIADCVSATLGRLGASPIKSVEDVLASKKRFVDVSEDLVRAWRMPSAFYDRAMRKGLFNHRIVLRHTYNARQKIRRLFCIYNSEDGYALLPGDYKRMTEVRYNELLDASNMSERDRGRALRVLTIRNYIAGMTDAYVNQKLREYTT